MYRSLRGVGANAPACRVRWHLGRDLVIAVIVQDPRAPRPYLQYFLMDNICTIE